MGEINAKYKINNPHQLEESKSLTIELIGRAEALDRSMSENMQGPLDEVTMMIRKEEKIIPSMPLIPKDFFSIPLIGTN